MYCARRCGLLLLSVLLVAIGADRVSAAAAGASFAAVVDSAQPKMVKIRGAGGLRGLEAYQSGFLISPQGHILTTWSYVLDTDTVSVTLADGRKLEAKLVGADPALEIAVLKIEGEELPCFDLASVASPAVGQRVLALSNLFGVAAGDEPVSVLHGHVSAIAQLNARRGAFESPYVGPVFVLDAMTNNPGAAGGALIDHSGKLLGMLGKELRDARNNIWLNYALPASEITESVTAIRDGKSVPQRTSGETPIENPVRLRDLGIVLVPNVLDRTPPYIDAILPDTPAARAGLRVDDLVVLVAQQPVRSSTSLQEELQHIERDDELALTVMRGTELIHVTLQPASNPSP